MACYVLVALRWDLTGSSHVYFFQFPAQQFMGFSECSFDVKKVFLKQQLERQQVEPSSLTLRMIGGGMLPISTSSKVFRRKSQSVELSRSS
jgi:hypothetical protein